MFYNVCANDLAWDQDSLMYDTDQNYDLFYNSA